MKTVVVSFVLSTTVLERQPKKIPSQALTSFFSLVLKEAVDFFDILQNQSEEPSRIGHLFMK